MELSERALPLSGAPRVVETVAGEAVAMVRRWLSAAAEHPAPTAEARMRRLLADPDGADWISGFIDGVLRPADQHVAGRNLERLARRLPASLRWQAGVGTQLAGGFAPLLPAPIVPAVREAFLSTLGTLFLRLGREPAGTLLADLQAAGGIRPTLAPVAARVSGLREANRQLADLLNLLAREDVHAVSLRLESIAGPLRLADLDGLVEEAVDRLDPLFALAGDGAAPKTVCLEVERLEELEATVQVFQAMCERHPTAEAELSLPAGLPESLNAVTELADWSRGFPDAQRPPRGVRLVKGLRQREHRGEGHRGAENRGEGRDGLEPTGRGGSGGPSADVHAQYLRMLDAALRPEHAGTLRVVAATHNLFDTAYAWRLARARGVERNLEHEFMKGLATREAEAAKRDVGGIRLYTPVVQHGRLPLIVPYLLRRVGDLSGTESFLSRNPVDSAADFSHEEARFRRALLAAGSSPPPLRRQDPVHDGATDFTSPVARDWARGVLLRAVDSAAGEDLVFRSRLGGLDELEDLLARTRLAGTEWGQRRGSTRATVLESVADTLAEKRGLLVEVAVSESGLTIEEADAEVGSAIASARSAAASARTLSGVENARFVPSRLTVVVAPRTGAVAAAASGVLRSLAAGSSVVLKSAPQAARSAAVLIDLLQASGVPPALLALMDDEAHLAEALISHPTVDRVLLDGSRHTAKLFRSWRAELPLQATIGGRNSVIVTPSADLETAVEDVMAGAFDHAGQAVTAAGVVILVGSVGESARFLGRLRDAVGSLAAGPATSAGTQLSSLVRRPAPTTAAALEALEGSESWIVRPRRLDDDGRVWSAGLRDGVQPGSAFHTRENRAPVLGILRAEDLAEAIAIQNGLGFGLAAGIQSTDAVELARWVAEVSAGMLFVNRPVVPPPGLPFGGWGRSSIGVRTAAGGPVELLTLGDWEPVFGEPVESVILDGVSAPVAALVEAAQPGMTFAEFDRVRAGAQSDERARRAVLAPVGGWREVGGGRGARVALRFRPLPVTVRLADSAPPADLVRVLAAATLAGAPVAISSAVPLDVGLIELFAGPAPPLTVTEVVVESDIRWHTRVQAGGVVTERIRLLGGDARVLARVLHGQARIAVHGGAVTTSGVLELLPFLREQSIAARVVRDGRPDPAVAALRLT